MSRDRKPSVGVVVIGRNEGDRLGRCLDAIGAGGVPALYVDSASTDGSVELARDRLTRVHELDDRRPLSAARARNEGFEALTRELPALEIVQFVDGDCVLNPEWLGVAAQTMADDPSIYALAGVLREDDPNRSVYNRLCDMEWAVPPGEAEHCGGIFACRAPAFREAGGFDPSLVAGEEPDLCRRLKSLGGRVVRIDAPMATHDAAMTSFAQWWPRAVRSGYGAAAVAARSNWRNPTPRRTILSALFWAVAVPTVAAAGAVSAVWIPWSLGLTGLAILAVLGILLRIAWRKARTGVPVKHAILYAAFCVLAKPAQTIGLLRWVRKDLRRPASNVEHGAACEPIEQPHRVR